jgi:two-component system, OmpR family, sensor histidine kinase KdpD
VGKTTAMLLAAQRERLAGRDVVICCLETHGSRELEALVRKFPTVPQEKNSPNCEQPKTFIALDAVLTRRPHSVVVDDLAFSNSLDSWQPKRHQGVLGLLDAGIDVYATLSVQQIASRAGTVAKITGVAGGETVPDSLLDEAKIELVDLEPEKLLKRLREGKVHLPPGFGFVNNHVSSKKHGQSHQTRFDALTILLTCHPCQSSVRIPIDPLFPFAARYLRCHNDSIVVSKWI